jgi:hypothetical protein
MSDQPAGITHTGEDLSRIRQRAKMQQMADAGFNKTRTTQALGISGTSVHCFEKKSGVRFQKGRSQIGREDANVQTRDAGDMRVIDPDDYREAIQDMKPTAAVDHLLGLLDGLTHQLPEMNLTPMAGLTLTRLEARLLYHLDRNRARPVTQEAVMFAMYQIRPYEDWPEISIVGVRICKLRQKLRHPEVSGLRIEVCRGIGFRLRVDKGVTLDWYRTPHARASA